MAQLYGKTHVRIESDVVDRVGLRTLVLSKFWSPSRGDLSQLEIDAEAPPVPAIPGGVLLIGEQTRQTSGGLVTTWTFEGVKGNGKTVTWRGRKDSLDYGFESGFTQASIRLHPKFHEMLDVYGGHFDNEGNVIWPPQMPSVATAGGLGAGGFSSEADGQTNPMFGIDEFFRMEGSYRFRYISTQIPGEALSKIGRSMPSGALPGEAPIYEGRNWLKLPVVWGRRGFIYEVTEMYWLSGEGGWPKPVYDFKGI